MVKKWFSSLLDELEHSYSDILLINDPDKLSLIEDFQKEIPDEFIVHQYKSDIELRRFESKHKSAGKRYIIFRSSEKDYFPYAVESKAELLNWSLEYIFPGLNAKVVRSFPTKFYQKIFNKFISTDHSFGTLDANETLNLICSWLWRIKLQEITTNEGIIHLLSNIYDDCNTIPTYIKEWIIFMPFDLPDSVWLGPDEFNDWLISQLNQYNSGKRINQEYGVDFGSDELITIREKIRSLEFRTTLSVIKKNIESIRSLLNCDPIDWFTVAKKWGELSYLKDSESKNIKINVQEYIELDKEITNIFEGFIISQYKKQFYENSLNNLMTIDRVLQHIRYHDGEKKLLFCFDGMGFQEWYCIKSYLTENGITNFKEDAIYAMLPTVTSISRGALFNGNKDISKHKPDDRAFVDNVSSWDNFSSNEVLCVINADLKWHEYYKDYKCLGIVVNIVDDTAHEADNSNCSKRLMQTILNIKLKETEITKIFRNFIESGYEIFITSDHGTVWCKGNDEKIEKYLVDKRSKRALIYPKDILARDFYRKMPNELYIYRDYGVLGEKSIIFPKGRYMFAKKENTAISHGGIHIEEVIVPFIEVLA
jgi:hypothetical protein